MVSGIRLVKTCFNAKGFRLAFKETGNIDDFKHLFINSKLSFNSNAKKVDVAIIQKRVNSDIQEQFILSLKDSNGKLLNRYTTGFDGEIKTVSTYNYNDVTLRPQHFAKKEKYTSDYAVHNRKQTIHFVDGIEDSFVETDVIRYTINNTRKALKTTYSTTNQNLSNETVCIEGLLSDKGKTFKKVTYFDKQTGEIIPSKTYSKGFNKNRTNWVGLDPHINLRFQSNPTQLGKSIIKQLNLRNTHIEFCDLPSNSYGFQTINEKGEFIIVINKNLNREDTISTIIHEAEHVRQNIAMRNYLSNLIKGKTDDEIIDYVAKNNDDTAYLYNMYLKNTYGDKNSVRLIAFNEPVNTNTNEIKELIKADRNYIPAEKDYTLYRKNFMEDLAWGKEKQNKSSNDFYIEDYMDIFTPNYNGSWAIFS